MIPRPSRLSAFPPFRFSAFSAALALLASLGTPSSSSASASIAPAPTAINLPPVWQARVAALAAPRTLSATFTESRTTPLKKTPVIVTGTVRIDRARGLSLAYDQTRAPVVILDAAGLLLRYPDGTERPAPPSAEPDLRLLHALFSFDLPTLEKSYALTVTETPDATWTLTFTRLPAATASYRELTLVGEAAHLTTIRLTKTPNLRTTITLSPPTFLDAFAPADLARYFR